jgi:hypothetical protein
MVEVRMKEGRERVVLKETHRRPTGGGLVDGAFQSPILLLLLCHRNHRNPPARLMHACMAHGSWLLGSLSLSALGRCAWQHGSIPLPLSLRVAYPPLFFNVPERLPCQLPPANPVLSGTSDARRSFPTPSLRVFRPTPDPRPNAAQNLPRERDKAPCRRDG